jgi:hypothetical protein
MVTTKADPLHDRMEHTFGDQQMMRVFENMVSGRGRRNIARNLLDYLTDDARDELLRRCLDSHKLRRRFAAESRKHHRENSPNVKALQAFAADSGLAR